MVMMIVQTLISESNSGLGKPQLPSELLKALAADSTQTIALKGSQPGKGTSPCIEPLS